MILLNDIINVQVNLQSGLYTTANVSVWTEAVNRGGDSLTVKFMRFCYSWIAEGGIFYNVLPGTAAVLEVIIS